jgi:hypothetical protein
MAVEPYLETANTLKTETFSHTQQSPTVALHLVYCILLQF